MRRFLSFLFTALLSVGTLAVQAAESQTVDYTRDVKPLLKAKCYACHGALKQEADLRLDTAKSILTGNGSDIVLPGKPDQSVLLERIGEQDPDLRMPPEGEGEALAAAEISIIRRWIDQGAAAPKGEKPEPDPGEHWAYQIPQKATLPQVTDARFAGNPIDRLLHAKHAEQKLVPLPAADRRTLLRRIYFDLVGLPPTPAQMKAFLEDKSPEAYERVVDELLSRDEYGERWGRHWMDVWRYSDWAGYKQAVRFSQRHIWHWRDWIIESLNEDKGYDQMVREMIAGDELSPSDPNVLRATGFLVRNWRNSNRNHWLEMTVEHTSKAFLGMTMNCSKCHDHKYDPIPQTAYYQMRAIFEPHNVRTDTVPGELDITNNGLPRVYDANLESKTYLYIAGNEKKPDKSQSLDAAMPDLFGSPLEIQSVDLPALAYYPSLRASHTTDLLHTASTKIKDAAADIAAAEADKKKINGLLAKAEQAEKTPVVKKPQQETDRKLFLADDFSKPRSDLWAIGEGKWKHTESCLLQEDVSNSAAQLTAALDHPRDFTVKFEFEILAGSYRSVGFSFDKHGADHHSVYLSAHEAGPKLQVSHSVGGQGKYPIAGKKDLSVQLGKVYKMEVLVQGPLVQVTLDGKQMLTYQLPSERKPGKFSVWSFAAKSKFHDIQIHELSSTEKLVKPAGKGARKPRTTAQLKQDLQAATGAIALSQMKHDLAKANLESLQARIAADRAKYLDKTADQAKRKTIYLAAYKAEQTANHLQAKVSLLRAEQTLATAKKKLNPKDKKSKDALSKAEQALKAAQENLKKSEAALQTEGTTYKALGKVYNKKSSGRRTALANWIANSKNPLTARVAVNHIWLRHFGSAIVKNTFDLGLRSKQPLHADLLDWLAVELMENDWSMKHIHRTIVTSQTYRMQSDHKGVQQQNIAVDPENRYLWRMNSRRLEAEIVRDAVLHVAGNLDFTRGGPDIDYKLGFTSRRRSVYFRSAYEKQMLFMQLFDGVNVNDCYRRSTSVVPQQALALANSQLTTEQSRLLSRKITQQLKKEEPSEEQFVQLAFEFCLQRPPTEQELQKCTAFLKAQSERLLETSKLSKYSGGTNVTVAAARDPQQRSRDNLVHVLMNHNDFVTVR